MVDKLGKQPWPWLHRLHDLLCASAQSPRNIVTRYPGAASLPLKGYQMARL